MSSAPRKSMHPAVVVALGVLLFVGVFALVQWLLHPLGAPRDASAGTDTSPAPPPPQATPDFGSGGSAPSVAEAAVGMPGGLSPGTGVDSDGRSCRIALTGVSSVSRACATGGIAAAKKEMKRLVFAAKANGVTFACDSCHEGSSTENDLVGDARDKFVELVAAAGPATPSPP